MYFYVMLSYSRPSWLSIRYFAAHLISVLFYRSLFIGGRELEWINDGLSRQMWLNITMALSACTSSPLNGLLDSSASI